LSEDTQPKIDDLLRFMVKQGASDLHLKPMRPPLVRLNGKLLPLKLDPLPPDTLCELLQPLLSERHARTLEEEMAVDFGYSLPGVARFRCSMFYQRGNRSAVFRNVPFNFRSLDEWDMPEVLGEFSKLPQGLVLITGPTGSGKSSTLAALMRLILEQRLVHVVTVEDPIEFLLTDDRGSVSQREVGTDTPSFSAALRNALRQDPDVIMVGEMRDRDTMQTVLTAAETGHLVFSTLHTNSAVQTIDRFIDSFPAGHHRQIRQQLASVLEAVVSLILVERTDGGGLVAAVEILRKTPRTSKLVQEGNLESLQEEIEGSVSYHKMQSMNQSLAALVVHGEISHETALAASINPGDLDLTLRKLLYASDAAMSAEGDEMAESVSDFSKILELQEIKRLYEEVQERHAHELSEREEAIEQLRAELDQAATQTGVEDGQSTQLRQENERLQAQVTLIRQEYESKIERLNARIRELSGTVVSAAAPEPERKGFFRR